MKNDTFFLQSVGPSCKISPAFLVSGGNPNPFPTDIKRLTPWTQSGDGSPTIRLPAGPAPPLAPRAGGVHGAEPVLGEPGSPRLLRCSELHVRCLCNYRRPAKSRHRHEVTVYQLITEPLIQPSNIMNALLMATAPWKPEFAVKADVLPRQGCAEP